MRKRILSLLLAVTMVLTLLPVTAWAEEVPPVQDSGSTPAIGQSLATDSNAGKPDATENTLSVNVSSITDSGAELTFTGSADGTVSYLVQKSDATAPDEAAVLAGETVAVTTGAAITAELTGLTAEMDYTAYALLKSGDGGRSAVVSTQFTTEATKVATPGNAVRLAADSVPYLGYENGAYVTKYVENPIDFNIYLGGVLSSDWYLVTGNVTASFKLALGDVHIILADGASLTLLPGGGENAGLAVPQGSTLSIYAQSVGDDMGRLTVTGDVNAAGIGEGGSTSCGTINIYGGDITATGGTFGAGIGSSSGSCGAVNIYGGDITATGGSNAAGIGTMFGVGGCHFGNICIYDGHVTASNGTGGSILPDIGGSGNESDSIRIMGGTVSSNRTGRTVNLGVSSSSLTSNPTYIIGGGSLFVGIVYVGTYPLKNESGEALPNLPAMLTIPDRVDERVASILIDGTRFGNGTYTNDSGMLFLYLTESNDTRTVVVTMEDDSQYWGLLSPFGFATLVSAKEHPLLPGQATFDKFLPLDISVSLLDTGSLAGISNAEAVLRKDVDYTVSSDRVNIKSAYLQALPDGVATLTFRFHDGSTAMLAVGIHSVPDYVALGDSIADGYGLPGYDPDSDTPPSDAYAVLLANAWNSSNPGYLAYSGADSDDLLRGMQNKEPWFRAYLQNAKTITLSIGSDDILNPFLQILAYTLNCDMDEIQQTLEEMKNDPVALNAFFADLSAELSSDTEMGDAVAQFETNFPAIIAAIKTAAPNAKIYVTNSYNPYLGVKFPYMAGTNPAELNLGAFTDGYVKALNEVFSATDPDYALIDVYSAFSASMLSGISPVNVNPSTMDFDPHPNAAGHALIADLIVSDYNGDNTAPTVSEPSLTVSKGGTASFTVSLGQGDLAATAADIAVTNGSIASVSVGSVTAPGAITVTGLAAGTTSITVTFNDSARTVKSIAVTVTPASNGGSPSSGIPATPPPVVQQGQQPNQPVTATAPVTAISGANGAAVVNISSAVIINAITSAQTAAQTQGRTANGIAVDLNVTMPPSATSLTANIPQPALQDLAAAGVVNFGINGGPVTLDFNQSAIQSMQSQTNGYLSINIAPASQSPSLPGILLGTVFDINLRTNSNRSPGQIISSLGSGTAVIGIPHEPTANQAVGYLFGMYVNASGNPARIPGSAYDANAGMVLIPTNHFSVYGVGYEAPSAKFTDIKKHWAKDSIDYVVGRGLLSGTAESTFAPDTAMTRGMLVTSLGRLAGVDTKLYTTNSFTDVKAGSAFRPYIEWAYKKGVVQGTGNGKFEPDRAVTREEIAVIFANFAKATGYTLPVTRTATTYADASSIGSTYKTAVTAMQQAGIMMGGSGNNFNPKSSATRAEVSSMLHRYIKLTIDPATAQGWAKNDAGQYLYYKDGKVLTGTQTIDSVKYFFETNGTLKTGWVKDDAGNWRYYTGNKAAVSWLDISDKRYYFTKDGIMVSGKWLEIGGKWYYFYADGGLAKNAKIDGYEVDKNGVRKSK